MYRRRTDDDKHLLVSVTANLRCEWHGIKQIANAIAAHDQDHGQMERATNWHNFYCIRNRICIEHFKQFTLTSSQLYEMFL